MRLYLINPTNPLVSSVTAKESRWNRYRVWKPLSLMVLAGLTPPEWEVVIVDENLGAPDYPAMPRPDLVGITAFTSQAPRAYEVAAYFRSLGVPVVMGGIHATMCVEEVLAHVDSVVTREAEGIWPRVLADARQGGLKRQYDGGFAKISEFAPARHDLLPTGYAFGAIQTTRGCPLNCTFCSVTTFNGALYRQRPIPDVVREFQSIREKRILVVDDLRDGPLTILGSVEGCHAAEAAIQGTAAGGLNGSEGISGGQQIMTGGHKLADPGESSVILAPQAAVPGVRQDLRPDSLGLPRDHRVHLRENFLHAHGGVNATHDDGHAQTSEASRHLIGAGCLGGESGDAHQIRSGHGRVVRRTEVLIHDDDFPLRRRQAREHHQAERFPHPVTIPAAFLGADATDQRIGRIDQVESHGVRSLLDWTRRGAPRPSAGPRF